jgi:hypothetical protein
VILNLDIRNFADKVIKENDLSNIQVKVNVTTAVNQVNHYMDTIATDEPLKTILTLKGYMEGFKYYCSNLPPK